MRIAGILAIVALAGCDQVFGIAGAPIDSGGTSGADALPATCRATPPLEPDGATYLVDSSPRGDDAEILTDAAQPALVRFGIDGIQGNEHVAAAILNVTPVTRCGATACTPCPSSATSFQLFWNFEDWMEKEATRTHLDSGTMWNAPMSAGTGDRSAQLVAGPLPTGQQLALRIPMTAVASVPADSWIGTHGSAPMTRLSLQLLTNAAAAFASDDHDESMCGEAAPPPSLVLILCE